MATFRWYIDSYLLLIKNTKLTRVSFSVHRLRRFFLYWLERNCEKHHFRDREGLGGGSVRVGEEVTYLRMLADNTAISGNQTTNPETGGDMRI